MKKTIIIIIIIILVILGITGLMWWGKLNQKAEATKKITSSVSSQSGLVVSEKVYDFGSIKMSDGNVEKVFKVTNSTDKDINLENVTTSCMCTAAYIQSAQGEKGPFGMVGHGGTVPKANEIIKAGESRDIKAVYNPNAHGPAGVGIIDRFIYLEDNTGGTLELEIKAIVTP